MSAVALAGIAVGALSFASMPLLNSIFSNPAFCDFGGPTYLLFSSNVPPLVYYSHIPITLVSLILGFFVLFKNKKALPNRILFCLTLAFSAWVFLDSIFWATNRSDVIMFVWSLQILFEPIVYISALYLLHVLIRKQDISFEKKLLIGLLYLPVIIIVPTEFSLSAFNLTTCLSEESSAIIYLSYGLEILLTLWIIGFSVKEFSIATTKEARRQILTLTIGTILLLLAFSSGNIVGSFTENWNLAQFGLFGMPVFLAFLAYTIVKFRTFDIKLLGVQALIVSLLVLIGSQFFFIQNDVNRVLTAITLLITGGIGINLIRSVKKEVAQREKIQKQEEELEKANERLKDLNDNLSKRVAEQTSEVRKAYEIEKKARADLEKLDQNKNDFIIITQHHLRTPISQIRWYANSVSNGLYGAISEELATVVSHIEEASEKLANILTTLLDISQLKVGKQILNLRTENIKPIIEWLLNDMSSEIKKRGIAVNFPKDDKVWPQVLCDSEKIKDALSIILDNAVKYNNEGGTIHIRTREKDGMLIVSLANTGILLTQDDRARILKESFFRSTEAKEVNSLGMGVGLLAAKTIIEAHHGTIAIQENDEGSGAVVSVQLPLASSRL